MGVLNLWNEIWSQIRRRGLLKLVRVFGKELRTRGLRGVLQKTNRLLPAQRFADDVERKEFLTALFQNAENKTETREIALPLKRLSSPLATRVMAFVLPQFHRTDENDSFWEPGFTEWTNSTKAVPQFLGQHQPQLPYEIGFYDMSSPETIRAQAVMARSFGISGFCFHYYWFSGRKVLNKPIENFLAQPDIQFDFCINWANENWTRRWDGREGDVLLEQNNSEQDYENIFSDWLPILRDPRYLKSPEGCPILIIYRPSLFPSPTNAVQIWRRLAAENGLPGLHLLMTNAFEDEAYENYGFDGIVEFPPHGLKLEPRNVRYSVVNEKFSGHIYDMIDYFESDRFKTMATLPNLYRCVFPSWDNEARKPGRGASFQGVTPARFKDWTLKAISATASLGWADRRKLLFVNAWNEWAEGAKLEPDRRYGFAYLNALARALEEDAQSSPATSLNFFE